MKKQLFACALFLIAGLQCTVFGTGGRGLPPLKQLIGKKEVHAQTDLTRAQATVVLGQLLHLSGKIGVTASVSNSTTRAGTFCLTIEAFHDEADQLFAFQEEALKLIAQKVPTAVFSADSDSENEIDEDGNKDTKKESEEGEL